MNSEKSIEDEKTKKKLLDEIRKKGYHISSMNGLMKTTKNDKDLIPIILKYIQIFKSLNYKELLIESLVSKEYEEITEFRIKEFNQSDDINYKSSIGNSLGNRYDERYLPEYLLIARNKKHGLARQPVIENLWRYYKKCETVKTVLIELLDDEEVLVPVFHAMDRAKDPSLIPYIEPFLIYKETHIRNEANSTIESLLIVREDEENEKRLLEEVRQKGYQISSMNDLMRMDKNNKDLIPVVLKYIKIFKAINYKEPLVRSLGVREYKEVTDSLIKEFLEASNLNYKASIGNSISIIYNKQYLPEYLFIVRNREHGQSRSMIVHGLWRYYNESEDVKAALIELLDDRLVVYNAIYSMGRSKDPSLIPYIEPFLSHDETYIRNEAKKAIERLSKFKK